MIAPARPRFAPRVAPSIRRALALAIVVPLAIACHDSTSSDGPDVARIEATPNKLDLLVGETKVVSARALDAAGAPVARKLFWSSATPTVATVTQEGIVSAIAPGTSEIAVSGGGKSTVVPVTVAGRPAALLRITPSTTSLRVGQSSSLMADVLDATGAVIGGRTITWSSSNASIATVNASGVITGVGAGNTTVTATSGSVSGTALVSVQLAPVASLSVAPTSASLLAGESLQLTADPRDANNAPLPGRTVTWSTSAATIATVSSTGFVIAFSPGTATITATSEGKSATTRITVTAVPVASVSIIPGSVTVAVKQTAQLVARVADSTGAALNGRAITWSSSAPNVATVDNDGTVTAIATGTARITATSEGQSGAATVTVTPVPVATLDLSPATLSLIEGETSQLTARVRDAQGNMLSGRLITYISGAPGVATVDATGIVTAVGPGSALIIATSEGARATTTVTVVAASVANVAVSPGTGNLQQGEMLQLTAAVTDTRGLPMAGKTVTWTSSNAAVATVSANGVVRAVAPGNATITATSDGVAGSASIAVSLVPVASVTLTPSPASVFTGRTLQLTVTLEDARGNALSTAGRTIAWTSSAPHVATVSSSGVVTGTAAGSATISATVQGIKGSTALTVTDVPVSSVTVAPSTTQLTVGGSIQLLATARDAGGSVITGRSITWSSSDPTIASVSSTGLASALAAGTAQLTATIEGVQGTASLTVIVVPVTSVVVSPQSPQVTIGNTVQLSAAAKDAAGNTLAGRTASWSSSNTAVATVDANGLVTAVAAGSSTMTATVSGIPGTSSVTVTPVPVASVVLTPPTASIDIGATLQLSATSKDAAGNTLTGRAATWVSDNTSIASVDANGLVTGAAVGSAKITVTVEGISASSTITVNAVPVSSIGVSPATASIAEGATTTLIATSKDAKGNTLPGRPVTWSTSASGVATVSAAGVVTGVASGTATITATGAAPAGGGGAPAGSSVVTVTPAPVLGQTTPVAGSVTVTVATPAVTGASRVVISPVSGTIHIGSTYARQVTAQALDAAGAAMPNEAIIWTTSAPQSLTIAPNSLGTSAVITAVGSPTPGVRLIASTTGATPVADTIQLSSDLVPITSVSVAPASATVAIGASLPLTATALDSAGNAIGTSAGNPLGARSETWVVSDAAIASVSSTGIVTGQAVGNTTVDVLVGGVGPASAAITVTQPAGTSIVTSVAVTPTTMSVIEGATAQFTATPLDRNGRAMSGKVIAWNVSSASRRFPRGQAHRRR